MGLRGPALASVIGTTAGLAFFLFGYDQGDLAGILTIPSFRRQFPQTDTIGRPDDYNVANLQGITVGIWNLGCFFSAILTIMIGDKLGRKKTMLMGLTFLAIGEIIQAASFSWPQFLVGRAIAGWGNGFNTATVPAWQAECTKPIAVVPCSWSQLALSSLPGSHLATGWTLRFPGWTPLRRPGAFQLRFS